MNEEFFLEGKKLKSSQLQAVQDEMEEKVGHELICMRRNATQCVFFCPALKKDFVLEVIDNG